MSVDTSGYVYVTDYSNNRVQKFGLACVDNDSDGYGNPGALTCPYGVVTDCNDNNAAINPGATEVCNGVDDNCNTLIDEGVQNTYYEDFDSDTYGNALVTTLACIVPSGYVTDDTDCDDSNASIYPGALVDGSGTNISGDIVIAGGASAQVAASVDVDWFNTKLAVVSWADDVNGADYDVYRAEVDQTGNVSMPVIVAGQPTGAANNQQGPVVAYSEDNGTDNGFLMLWRDNRSGTDYDLYGMKVWP